MADKVHLLRITFIRNNSLSRLVDSAIQADNDFIDKSSLTFFKEVVKGAFEFFEHTDTFDDLCLHIGGELLIEGKFFNNEIEI